jgi:hypothetical protein
VFESYSRAFIDRRRVRLASMLSGEIPRSASTLPRMTENRRMDAVAGAHRRPQGIGGLAPTIGFAIVVGPDRARRALPSRQLARPMENLESVRCAGQAETQTIELNWGLVS